MPKDLTASTLFGYRKGAFTGANKDSIGLFEAALGGTLILDEISEMSNEAQVHLLRALQERKIRRLSETQLRDIDVRVIAITNKDLEVEVKSGRFREDLYYRLNVFPIHLPPLRDRLDDIPLLAEHFLQKACRQLNKEIDGFADKVFEMLASYNWPGNVRELENEINRAAALMEEGLKIQKYHFSSKITKWFIWQIWCIFAVILSVAKNLVFLRPFASLRVTTKTCYYLPNEPLKENR